MSAIPTPIGLADAPPVEAAPLRIPGLDALAFAARTAALLALAMLVPGEAERIGARIAPRRPE